MLLVVLSTNLSRFLNVPCPHLSVKVGIWKLQFLLERGLRMFASFYFFCLLLMSCFYSSKSSLCMRVCSIMSNSLQPHELQPTRLLCPWDFPGKNTGVGCKSSLQRSININIINSLLPLLKSSWFLLIFAFYLSSLWRRPCSVGNTHELVLFFTSFASLLCYVKFLFPTG